MQEPITSVYWNAHRGRWGINCYWPGTKKRKRMLLGETVRSQADAEAKLAEFRETIVPAMVADQAAEVQAKRQDAAAGPKIADLATWYLETHCPHVGLADKTIAHYSRVLRDFQAFCSHRHVARMQQVSTRMVEEWQAWLAKFRDNGVKVRRDEMLALRYWVEQCIEAGELPDPPKIQWRIPGKSRTSRFRALSAEEEAAFLEAIAGRDIEPVCLWCLYAGWRISDVLDFRWKEIAGAVIDREQIKTKAGLCYPLTQKLRDMLPPKRHPEYVFTRPGGEPWGYMEFAKKLDYLVGKRLPFSVCARDLRKTFGSRKAMAGCPPNILKELMGHEDITLTLTYYVDVDLGKMAEWVEIGIPEHAATCGNRTQKGRK